MSPAEVGQRAVHEARKRAWRSRQVTPTRPDTFAVPRAVPGFASTLAAGAIEPTPTAVRGLVAAADGLVAGRWSVLGVGRLDAGDPDWFLDPVTGGRAPDTTLSFAIDHRRTDSGWAAKNVWELSRHQQLSVLAAAYHVTGCDAYASAVGRQLRSWWQANPFLSGIHWTSGIELGIRLVSWVWIRRLLDRWDGAQELFEQNPAALRQIAHHQEYLAAFMSTGSSANNHLIAEAAGLVVAGTGFAWFDASAEWSDLGMTVLLDELDRQTDRDGLNRELASEYHGLVLELALAAAAELALAGRAVPARLADVITRMIDGLAAIVDVDLRPPRQGDGDGGFGLLLDDPGRNRWASLLAAAADTIGATSWWPEVPAPDVSASLLASSLRGSLVAPSERPTERSGTFAEAGMTIVRSKVCGSELWCRLDAGPHGYLSIAAHAHADALSLELRHDGVDVLADPGTYCYQGDPQARQYFRSTRGHNTLELAGRDQSTSGGPFMWTRHARTRPLGTAGVEGGSTAIWSAEHDGYRSRRPRAVHRRMVILERPIGTLTIVDDVGADAAVAARLSWHLGPAVRCEFDGRVTRLAWFTRLGEVRALLVLPEQLEWTVHEGELDPPLGWFSPSFGVRVPAVTLVGTGTVSPRTELRTVLALMPDA
jgi:Heparinase II/III-like protein/Heparinase II/III N-terminus